MTLEAAYRFFANWPDWLIVVVVVTGAVLGTLLVERVLRIAIGRIVARIDQGRREHSRRFRWPLRLIVLTLLLIILDPAFPLGPQARGWIDVAIRLLAIGAIGLALVTAVNVLADIARGRFRIDVADNLEARRRVTQIQVLRRITISLIGFVTLGAMLMTIPAVQRVGVSLLASAGIAGLILGIAARPVLSNILAGIQLALTQPIRVDDVVIVEGEWGWIEEITTTYVVIRVWDWRRLIVPLSYFIEKPFQNWTRTSASIIGSVTWYVDYTVPIDAMRAKLDALVRASPHWDGQVSNLQVTNATERSIEVRGLMSARDSSEAWNLRCEVREKMIGWLQAEYPDALPRIRAHVETPPDGREPSAPEG
jgi:small-conductance mechanosensitive channel